MDPQILLSTLHTEGSLAQWRGSSVSTHDFLLSAFLFLAVRKGLLCVIADFSLKSVFYL